MGARGAKNPTGSCFCGVISGICMLTAVLPASVMPLSAPSTVLVDTVAGAISLRAPGCTSSGIDSTASATRVLTWAAYSGWAFTSFVSNRSWARSTFFSVRNSTAADASTTASACSPEASSTVVFSMSCASETLGEGAAPSTDTYSWKSPKISSLLGCRAR